MIWFYTSVTGAHQYSILYRSVKSLSLKDNVYRLYPFTYLKSVYWFQIVIFPSQIVFPYFCDSLESDLYEQCSQWSVFCQQTVLCHGIVSLRCAGYIKARKSMGWSDFTELQKRPHSLQRNIQKKSISSKSHHVNVQLNIQVWQGFAEVQIDKILTGYYMLLECR